jgi:hypothetical protein
MVTEGRDPTRPAGGGCGKRGAGQEERRQEERGQEERPPGRSQGAHRPRDRRSADELQAAVDHPYLTGNQ